MRRKCRGTDVQPAIEREARCDRLLGGIAIVHHNCACTLLFAGRFGEAEQEFAIAANWIRSIPPRIHHVLVAYYRRDFDTATGAWRTRGWSHRRCACGVHCDARAFRRRACGTVPHGDRVRATGRSGCGVLERSAGPRSQHRLHGSARRSMRCEATRDGAPRCPLRAAGRRDAWRVRALTAPGRAWHGSSFDRGLGCVVERQGRNASQPWTGMPDPTASARSTAGGVVMAITATKTIPSPAIRARSDAPRHTVRRRVHQPRADLRHLPNVRMPLAKAA